MIGTAALQGIGPSTAEIKRMWVAPACRRTGIGGATLDRLMSAAEAAGYGSGPDAKRSNTDTATTRRSSGS
jgi:ribosomal protein S18 acetylase RimI-like enzyme